MQILAGRDVSKLVTFCQDQTYKMYIKSELNLTKINTPKEKTFNRAAL